MKLKTGSWVAVCDAGKFLLLQNQGDVDGLDLRVVAHEEIDHSVTPGRQARGPSPDGVKARKGRAHSQSVEELSERRFVLAIASDLQDRIRSNEISELVLIADPKTLGVLRQKIPEDARQTFIAEISGDHAHDTIEQIEALLARH